MSDPPPPPQHTTPAAIPMGFSAQIRLLRETQLSQAHRISALEHENSLLKASLSHSCSSETQARISALEAHNTYLLARRTEAVTQLLNLRTLHQESANAFLVRAGDVGEDDFEGMLGVWATSVTTLLNVQQRALGMVSARGQMSVFGGVHGAAGCGLGYAWMGGAWVGWCYAHSLPYPCRVCGH
ncbi:uncharacterized protein M421DRAFT_424920 [Didymella exigua CBS 183.55]|uniref:Uncharacterized protein n=1 Tax=Didymella exigua CBS 183.55 TaxID=1150837 RepID=A0A6A5R959_9PLEO|nr:uncharacterized protein M421DRAFT_424920 [Didymella exigua CBS 183.55]KAF1924282.1 hypothetical protein M421DRAFT_424920 [Didymella exigua CBS 183.55]